MTMRKGLAAMAILAICGTVSPALAKITQYECKFPQDQARGGGWIPELLILTEDDKTGEIIVFDPIIKYFIGTPINAKLSARTSARSTYVWEVRTKNKGQTSRRKYTFSYRSNGMPASIRVQPAGYDNVWTGEGTCKVTAG